MLHPVDEGAACLLCAYDIRFLQNIDCVVFPPLQCLLFNLSELADQYAHQFNITYLLLTVNYRKYVLRKFVQFCLLLRACRWARLQQSRIHVLRAAKDSLLLIIISLPITIQIYYTLLCGAVKTAK